MALLSPLSLPHRALASVMLVGFAKYIIPEYIVALAGPTLQPGGIVMQWARVWAFSFACVVAGLWAFPRVDTAYMTRYSATPIRIVRSRPLATEMYLGMAPASREEFRVSGANRTQTALNWPSQWLQTLLAVGFFIGLRWAVDPGWAPGAALLALRRHNWRLRSTPG